MSFSLSLWVAGLAGFVALSYEIIWYRAYGVVSRSMPTTFGLLLGAYLAGVAAGSLGSRAFCHDDARLERRRLLPVAAFVYLANLASFLVVPALARLVTSVRWQLSLPLVALSAGLLGAVLPLASHFGIRPDDRAGARLSYLYVANIVGSSLGSLVTGFVLLEHLSLRGASVALSLAGLALFALLGVSATSTVRGRAAVLGASAATLVATVAASGPAFEQLHERLFFRKQFTADKRFEHLIENRHGVIAVTDGKVYGGGVYDGILNVGLRHDPNWVFRAYALAAYHPAPKRVLMVGLASGAWARILAGLPGVERLTVVEINPGYLELIPKIPEVAPLLKDPKIEIVIDDGRRWIQRHPDARWDAIVMNTTWHWRGHSTNLLSAEFFELVRARLAPGGVFTFNTTLSEAVMKTAAVTFPYAQRMYNFMVVSDSPVAFDKARWKTTLTEYRMDGAPLLDPEHDAWDKKRLDDLLYLPDTLDRPPVWEGLESRESLLARFGHLPTVTDDNMWCEWHPSDLEEEDLSPRELDEPVVVEPFHERVEVRAGHLGRDVELVGDRLRDGVERGAPRARQRAPRGDADLVEREVELGVEIEQHARAVAEHGEQHPRVGDDGHAAQRLTSGGARRVST